MGKGMKNLKIKSYFKDNFKGNLSTKHQTAWGGGGYRSSMGCSTRRLKYIFASQIFKFYVF